ncbi:hypothetical protein POPTR_008G202133v4 [Populus trichocarpa]|uniref:Uncharacterized protein n=1 Tax=Populus trichocarpa TaxID=3694 RepID=A0A2K1ZKK5_POPTR|nr:hypothetical protein POPTR_008G202133v4 [Populus trichocarpa]
MILEAQKPKDILWACGPELVVFFGIITVRKYFLIPKILITFMFYGYKLFNTTNFYFFYFGPRELFVLTAIILPVISIGIYPNFVFSL